MMILMGSFYMIYFFAISKIDGTKKELFQLNLINSSCFFKNQNYKSIDGYSTIKVNKDKHGLYKILSTELFSQEILRKKTGKMKVI